MNPFSWLWPDLTRDWPASGAGPVTLNLRDGTVAGVETAVPWQALEPLGRPSRRVTNPCTDFTYPLRGFEAAVGTVGLVQGFMLVFQPCFSVVESEKGFTPCRLRVVRPDGVEATWTTATTEEDVRAHLGPPGGKHERGDGGRVNRTYEYQYPSCEVFLEFDEQRLLVCMDVDPIPEKAP